MGEKKALLSLMRDNVLYNKKVGIDATYISGNPGSGKSNILNLILARCSQLRKENVVFPGDIFCEWRHLARKDIYPEFEIIVPKGIKIKNLAVPQTIEKIITEIDYEDLEIMDYFPEGTTRKMVVVYDGHLREEIFHEKVNLWSKLLSQVVYRDSNNFTGFGLPFHEAGAYFPELAEGEHWRSIKSFCNKFNDARKSFTRILSASQLPTETNIRLRLKSPWRVWRRGAVERNADKYIKSRVPRLGRHEYVLGFGIGGNYTLYNTTDMFPEFEKDWRMIPKDVIPKTGKNGSNDSRNKAIKRLYEEGFNQERIGELYEISHQRVSQIINN